jgi:hypothetical protein
MPGLEFTYIIFAEPACENDVIYEPGVASRPSLLDQDSTPFGKLTYSASILRKACQLLIRLVKHDRQRVWNREPTSYVFKHIEAGIVSVA